MSDKVKIGLLAALVAALALWWLAGARTAAGHGERSFRERILRVDTAALVQFTLAPPLAEGGTPIHFRRDAEGWSATQGDHATRAFQRPMNTLLAALADMRPQAMPGSGPAVVRRYALTDSLAATFRSPQVMGGAPLRVGSTTQGPDTPTLAAAPVATAVMLGDDPNVYLVPGAFNEVPGMRFIDWIPKPMVNGNPADWDRITFTFPGNRSYALERQGGHWLVGGQRADGGKVEKYLWALSRYYGSGLAAPADTLHASLIYQLQVDGPKLQAPIFLGIFQAGDHLIARSTLAPRWLVMPFDPQVELPRMFRPPEAFLP